MKRSKLTLPALVLATALAMGCAAGGAGDTYDNGGNTPPSSGGKEYPVSQNECDGDSCRLATSKSRLKFEEVAQVYDNAIWASWSGGYHDDKIPFNVCGSTYGVDVNGKKKAPHFTDNDRARAEAAASQVLGK
ncbi:MAG: hypothetical protein LBG88_03895 [Christensenellaceae bacterium]|jgi:hypothetical protein|nr:hypothetical protein [Christensenellaceae bacterium]